MTVSVRISRAAFGWLLLAAIPALTAQTTKPAKPAPTAPAPKSAPSAPASQPSAVRGVSPAGKPAPASVVPNQGNAPVVEVSVETRGDGLAYLPGAKQPFTGKAITASRNFQDCVESITPYKNGRLHGDVMTLYKKGNPKTVRTYADGVPKKHIAYYQDGAKKFEQTLNAKDKAEGLYRRWFASGKLQAEATYDDEERWHGDNKEYLEDGKLKSHYIYAHGALQKIVYESVAAKAEREAPPQPSPASKK